MCKVFVIPDIHLKPWILDKAEEYLLENAYERTVCLGDIVDDWGQEENLGLYERTFDALIAFANRHPRDVSFNRTIKNIYRHLSETAGACIMKKRLNIPNRHDKIIAVYG